MRARIKRSNPSRQVRCGSDIHNFEAEVSADHRLRKPDLDLVATVYGLPESLYARLYHFATLTIG
jgi:hypothetical protein